VAKLTAQAENAFGELSSEDLQRQRNRTQLAIQRALAEPRTTTGADR
jgi:hypothetical protein